MKVGDKLVLDGVELEISMHDGTEKGYLHFGVGSVHVHDDGKEIGSVVNCTPIGVELQDLRVPGRPLYFLTSEALWKAFQRALIKTPPQ